MVFLQYFFGMNSLLWLGLIFGCLKTVVAPSAPPAARRKPVININGSPSPLKPGPLETGGSHHFSLWIKREGLASLAKKDSTSINGDRNLVTVEGVLSYMIEGMNSSIRRRGSSRE